MAQKRIDAYIRVSRRGSRDDESFLSPRLQREKIDRWVAEQNARGRAIHVAKTWEEIDQSGGTLRRPMLDQVLERCRRGDVDGLVVADRSRFARSLLDGLQVIRELESLGKTFMAADGFDSSNPEGRLAINMMLSFAEFELERIKATTKRAITGAVERGVHITGFVPTGYRRADDVEERKDSRGRLVRDGRLRVDAETAPCIRAAFRMRANGQSFQTIADYLASAGVRPSATRNPQWSRQGVRELLRNRVYLGEARGPGGAVNPSAHPAIVAEEEFESAQSVSTVTHPKDGSIASQAILVGLIRCNACGHNLTITGTTTRAGVREAAYYCRTHYATGTCSAPAGGRARIVDEYVLGRLHDPWESGDRFKNVVDLGTRYRVAEDALLAAETDLRDFLVNVEIQRSLGIDSYAAAVQSRQEAVDSARAVIDAIPGPRPDELPTGPPVQLGNMVFPYETWAELSPTRKRRHMATYIAEVRLRKAKSRREPISQRVTIRWIGDVEDPRWMSMSEVDRWVAEAEGA